ncbi:MAG TPA: hypothetical protein VKV32_13375 [Stellaceae bacterium]|nr:hypothetical protein [Stellaceae bacterium]
MDGLQGEALDKIKQDLVQLQSALDQVRRQSANVIERQILEQPFGSVMAAFALGFVLSRVVAKRIF